jgi:oxalate---CoA ligase
MGAALARLGVTRDSPIALVCSNGPAAATAFLGIAAHAACAPLNPAYRTAEFEFYLADLRPAAVVVEAGLESAVRNAAAALGIPVLELTAQSLDGALNAAGGNQRPAFSPQTSAVALLLHTSGTTSRPKLVPLTQANLAASARNIAASLALTPEDRCLNVMPLFHIHGLEAALLASLVSGGSVVCGPGFVAPKFFEWIEEFRPSWYTAVPTIHQSIAARAKMPGRTGDASSLRFIRSCSSALPPSLMQEMETIFRVPVIEAYGMTEAAHQMTSNPLPPSPRKPGSVGLPAGPEVAIMDDDGRLVPRGTSGEVVIRGPSVTAGYAANAEANAAAFTEGWFRTGDLGCIDRDGYLFLSGRRKEIINRGGEKIAPREVDETLLAHPAVAQAVAFAAPHSLLGEAVAAAVVLHPGTSVTGKDLREFASGRLAMFKIPEKILFLDEIPKGPTGKIQRIGLAARLDVPEIRPSAPEAVAYVAPRSRMDKQIAGIFAATLGMERVGMRDNFFDLGADSLLAAMLLARIRESAGVEIPFLEFAEDPTVTGICRLLQAGPARSAETQLRVVIRSGQAGPALFCIPGSHGNVAGFFQLARSLGHGQAVTAFRLPSWKAGYRLEELAGRYAAEAMEAQPEGPYHLAGVCTGGFVAYEMARQIRAKGREVGLLALLDCYNHAWGARLNRFERLGYRLDLLRRRFLYQQRQLRAAGVSGALDYMRPKLAALVETARHRWEERMHHPSNNPRLAVRLAAARYVPQVWQGTLDLFRMEEPHVDAYDYPEMGWLGLAQEGTTVHQAAGSHLTMFDEPYVRFVAERLSRKLTNPASRRSPLGSNP